MQTSSNNSNDEAIVDLDQLLGRCMNRKDLAFRVIERFVDAVEQDMIELNQFIKESKSNDVAKVASRMKIAAMTACAISCANHANNLQSLAEAVGTPATTHASVQLSRSIGDVRSLLKSIADS